VAGKNLGELVIPKFWQGKLGECLIPVLWQEENFGKL